MLTGRFRPTDRIRESWEYGLLAQHGRRKATRSFVMIVGRARRAIGSSQTSDEVAPAPRLGITVSRRVGNAVERNRIKRAVREWFRAARCGLRGSPDIVVIARREASGRSRQEIVTELDTLCAKLGIAAK